MAVQRQRKRRFATILAGFAMLGATLAVTGLRAVASTNEQIVSDPRSGLAISGYDPVAYFTDGQARLGLATLEQSYSGVVWRFRNEGNRAAFADDPDVYMPRYGGYDPVAVAQGKSVPGHPLFWVLADNKLYLFYDEKTRATFATDPRRYAADAESKWASVRAQLAR